MLLGRDQGIFQYVAWAIRHGVVDYRDIRDFNGPLVHAIHLGFAAVGGLDEARFRQLDLAGTVAAFGFVGACLPGITRSVGDAGSPPLVTRATWALAAIALLGAQYYMYMFWDIAQRESFFDWFVFAGVGCQLLATGNAGARWSRGYRRGLLLVAAGIAHGLCVFGKATFVVFGLCAFVVLLLSSTTAQRRRDVRAYIGGGLVAAAAMFLFVALTGDVRAFLNAYLVEGPRLYVGIWHVAPAALLARSGYPNYHLAGLILGAAITAFVVAGALPRRALLVALLPVAASAEVLLQGKGFPYHFHPLTAAIVLATMTLALAMAEGCAGTIRPGLRFAGTFAMLAFVTVVFDRLRTASPYLRPDRAKFIGLSWSAPHPDADGYFGSLKFAPRDLAAAAAEVRASTSKDTSLFVYGSDPYVYVLADRRSATPFFVPLQVNIDLLSMSEPGPSPAVRAAREAMRADNAQEMARELLANEPGACLFVDESPFLTTPDSWLDFETHAPVAADYVRSHFVESARFGVVRLFRRR